MMRYFSLLLAAGAAVALIGISACNNATDPLNPASTDLKAPTNVKAISSDGTVVLYWTASADAADAKFNGYIIDIMDGATALSSVTVAGAQTFMPVGGLTNGKVYMFMIHTAKSDGTKSTATADITWGPGPRFTNIKLYSLSSGAGCPSGLQLSPAAVIAVSTSTSPEKTDLVFDDRGMTMDLLSPTKKSGSSLPRNTYFMPNTADTAMSLDDANLARATVDTAGWVEADYPLGNDQMGGGLPPNKGEVYYVRTQDGNYARVLVRGTPAGSEIHTETVGACAGYKYIVLDVSFQPTPFVPYAGAQRTTGSGSH
jgi:hypothetical protein